MTDQTPSTEEHATVRLGTEIQRYAEGFPRSDFARVSDALAAHDRAMKAEAWEEGYEANSKDRVMRFTETHEQHVNPYRIEAQS